MMHAPRKLDTHWLAGLLVAALVAGGALHLFHQYQMPRIASAFLDHARRAEAENRPADALRHLHNYVSLLPGDAEGLALYGNQLAASGQIEPAYAIYEKLLRVAPDRDETRRTLVKLAMETGRHDDAQRQLEVLLERFPEDGELWQWKGAAHLAQLEYDEARAAFETAIRTAPERLEAYQFLAYLWRTKLKNEAAATACIDEMVAKNPDDYRARLNRAQWLIESLNTDGDETSRTEKLLALRADLRFAGELAPESADVLAVSAQVALAEPNLEEARRFSRRGLELHPDDARFYLALADVEAASSNPAAGLEVLLRGVAALPEDRELRWNLANLQVELGKHDDALASIELLQSVQQQSGIVGFLEARIWMQQGRWLDVIRRLEKIRSLLQDQPEIVQQVDYLLAKAYGEIDAPDQQLTCYRRAADLNSRWIPARMGLAESLFAANSVRQAAEEYRQILRLPGAPSECGIELARCLYRLNAAQPKPTQDWTEFDAVLDDVERRNPALVAVLMLRAEKLVVLGDYERAKELIAAVKEAHPDELDYWIAQISLAMLERNWDDAEAILSAAERRFGDQAKLRIAKGRYLLQRWGMDAGGKLRGLSQVSASWSEQEQFQFLQDFTWMFLNLGNYQEARRVGLAGAALRPGDLSIRLLLFDVSLRSRRPDLMKQVLAQVRVITGDGPLWNYGEAVRLTLQSIQDQNAGDLESARLYLAKAKDQRPGWTRIPLLAAEIEQLEGNAFVATEMLQEAISLGERHPNILSRTVSLLFDQRRFIEADQVVRRLSERDNVLGSDILRSASKIAIRLNNAPRAIDLAEELIRQSDDDFNRIWFAHVLGMLGRAEDAERQLRQVLETASDSPDPWIALVQLFVRNRQLDRAEHVVAEAEQAISVDEAPLAIAQCHEMLGKIESARAKYQLAREQSPADPQLLRRTIEFELRAGQSLAAEPLLQKLLALSQDDFDRRWANRQLAAILAERNDGESSRKARQLIEQNLAEDPASTADRRVKAGILAQQPAAKQRREAIAILESLLARGSDAPLEDRYLLAQLYLATGDRLKAREEFRRLLAVQNDDPRFLNGYLQLLFSAGETSEAELWLNRLQAVAPDDLTTAGFRAQWLFSKKRYAEVVELLSAASTDSESSGNKTEWGARQFEEFALKLHRLGLDEQAKTFVGEAESRYRRSVEQRPENILALAEFHGRFNRIDRALELLGEHASESDPERIAAVSAAVMSNPSSTWSQRTRLEDLLQSALKRHDKNVPLRLALADLMSWQEDYDRAILAYRKVLEVDEQNIAALNNLALVAALSRRDHQAAMELIDRAWECHGEAGFLFDTRGMIFFTSGHPRQALADFQESLHDGENAERHFHVSLAYLELRQLEAAKRALHQSRQMGLKSEHLHPLERILLNKLCLSLDE